MLPCCRNQICEFCLTHWKELSNSCPLCKGVLEDPDAALDSSLRELDALLEKAAARLTKIEAIAGHVAESNTHSSRIRTCMGDVCERAMRVGLFGHPAQPLAGLVIGIQQGVQGALVRDVISFVVASYMQAADEGAGDQHPDEMEGWREERVERD
jgi:hypothetical protein